MSEAKPLRWSFLLTFSIVVLAIWGVVLVCAHSQRARLVRELAACIEHGTESEAAAALRQMARMPDPPLETFAVAAASPSREIAREAKDSIAELLCRWQHQVTSGRSAGRVASRLEQLAAALDAQRESISSLDYPWLATTTEKILRLAGAAPIEDSVDLAMHCESLLTIARARPLGPRRDILPVASATIASSPDAIFSPPSRLALQSIAPVDEPSEKNQSGDSPVPTSTTTVKSDSASPVTPLRWSRSGSTSRSGIKSRTGIHQSPLLPLPRPFDGRQRADLKIASPIPVADATKSYADTPDPWALADSRSLLERWLAESGVPKQQIERELRRRGFGTLRADVVRLALSSDTAGRVRLVQDLFSTPGIGTNAWLLLLADDADAEVRLSAVTMMAASSDDQLLEKAWQIALHDQDPRIASLAERLRIRRDAPQRR